MTARRLAASAVDYALAAGWAGLLMLGVWILVDPPAAPPPATGRRLGFVALTIPVTVTLAHLESRGGTPGKRLVGLRTVDLGGARPRFARSLGRTVLKVGLPWELAHAAIWRIHGGITDTSTVTMIAASYLLPLAAGLALVCSRAPWYDLAAGTTVRIVAEEQGA